LREEEDIEYRALVRLNKRSWVSDDGKGWPGETIFKQDHCASRVRLA
jgi:hypothetical protein